MYVSCTYVHLYAFYRMYNMFLCTSVYVYNMLVVGVNGRKGKVASRNCQEKKIGRIQKEERVRFFLCLYMRYPTVKEPGLLVQAQEWMQ